MEKLFKINVNTQPLRKLEPLIRFDIDGNPQPRKPLTSLGATAPCEPIERKEPLESKPSSKDAKHPDQVSNAVVKPSPISNTTNGVKKESQVAAPEVIKRKDNQSSSLPERPKKQTKIMSFFTVRPK